MSQLELARTVHRPKTCFLALAVHNPCQPEGEVAANRVS